MPHPVIALRLSNAQVQMILPGLTLVIDSHTLWQRFGQLGDHDPELHWPRPGYDGGQYDDQAQSFLVSAHNALLRLGPRGGRLRLDHFQLAAFSFGARVTAMRLRHGHLPAWHRDWRKATARLIRRLEILQKRARRTCLSGCGQQQYHAVHGRWLRHLRWLRAHVLYCGCGRTRCPGMRHYYQRIVARCADRARAGIIIRGYIPPDDRRLRRLVRRALAAIRRGRTEFGVRTLVQNPSFAEDHLAAFVLKHCQHLRS